MTVQRRRDLNLPAGWHPTVHSTVQVLDSATLRPQDVPVAGLWRCIDHAPDGGWWLQPANGAAVQWAIGHGERARLITSGMVNVHALRLFPHRMQPPLPGSR